MRTKTLLSFLLLALVACTSVQEESPQLNTDQLIEDIRILSADEMQGRLVNTEGSEKARAYLLSRFEELHVSPFQGSFEHPFSFERNEREVPGINLIAEIEGETENVLLITAHYDHIGIRDSLIFNGADDNASGTAALLAMMEYFKQSKPTHTLVFAALDAEEGGLNGAVALAEDSLFINKVNININMDMIAQNQNNELYAVGTYHFPELKPVLEGVTTEGISLLFGHDRPEDGNQDWTYASDHGAFFKKGVPFIYFGVEDHEHYHRPTDEFETIPQEFYKNSVQVILNATIALDEYKYN